METPSTTSRRIQFSLSTLVLMSLLIAACMTCGYSYRMISRLREENDKLREEAGVLDIKDPERAWIRTIPTDEADLYRRRIYVPREGDYRVGWQTNDVDLKGIDRTKARYVDIHLARGEFRVEAKITRPASHERICTMTIIGFASPGEMKRWGHGYKKTKEFDPDDGFGGSLGNVIYPIADKSTAFEVSQPQFLFAFKMHKTITDEDVPGGGHSHSSESTTEPGPGLLAWFEVAPKK